MVMMIKKTESVASGFSDVSVEKKCPSAARSASKNSVRGSATDCAVCSKENLDKLEASDARSSRRGDSIEPIKVPERSGSLATDSDLLSNPFASESDEEKGNKSQRDSARSKSSKETKPAPSAASTDINT